MGFLKNRVYSFKNAFRGVFVFFTKYGGAHAKIHLLASIFVISLGLYFHINTAHWVALAVAIGLVYITEIINSAIEQLVDLIHPEWNDKAGAIKDMAAGAVLIAAIVAVIIGVFVFWSHVLILGAYLLGFHG